MTFDFLYFLHQIKPSKTAGRLKFPWHQTMIAAKIFLLNELFVVHPSMQKIVSDFFKSYLNFRLIDIENMKKVLPLTIEEFVNYIKIDVEAKKSFLLENWYQACVGFVSAYKEDIENLMPDDNEV